MGGLGEDGAAGVPFPWAVGAGPGLELRPARCAPPTTTLNLGNAWHPLPHLETQEAPPSASWGWGPGSEGASGKQASALKGT